MTMKCPRWIDPEAAFIPPEILCECLELTDRVRAMLSEARPSPRRRDPYSTVPRRPPAN